MIMTKEAFFKPGRLSASDKASAIDYAARQIVAKENAQRDKKTERLRELREARDAELAAAAPDQAKKPARSRKK
ncbi:hypothetical protein [Rhizobium sp. L1K21]|uniref:hypothetical protein n=1 Tax=Rhizobium sp. L1K21 TaxID=2954933 RepID=UPI00209257C5|nr:hypothetical protein [Rhizobium sp. L1K21]MCO6186760.1 hypothetical protein [Rhizobium sp. L1K21]